MRSVTCCQTSPNQALTCANVADVACSTLRRSAVSGTSGSSSCAAVAAGCGPAPDPAVVLPLLVGFYDRTDPEVFGFPFYFWSQMMMIPMAVVLTIIAYYLAKVAERRDRDNRREAGR